MVLELKHGGRTTDGGHTHTHTARRIKESQTDGHGVVYARVLHVVKAAEGIALRQLHCATGAVILCARTLLKGTCLSGGTCDVVTRDWRGHYAEMSGFLYRTAPFIPKGRSVGIHATGDELNCT